MTSFFNIIMILSLYIGPSAYARSVKYVKLNDRVVATIPIAIRGTVLSFPSKPTKVILGKKDSFGIEYVESDLAISPLNSRARSNLFVYLHGRRFVIDLITSVKGGYSVVHVGDARGSKVKIKYR